MIDLPEIDTIEKNLNEAQVRTAKRFWSALWNVYTRNKGSTSLIYWAEQMDCPTAMNKLLLIIKDWIKSDVIPERNWAQVQLDEDMLLTRFTEEQLVTYRTGVKTAQYIPRFKEDSSDDLVRVKGQVSKTGLVRNGFMLSGHTQYYYDVATLRKYLPEVVINTNKGMIKMREQHKLPVEDASYDQIAEDIVNKLAESPELFTQGTSFIDSRGRAIKEALKYVANPIGYKDFRSLITIPQPE